MKVLVGYVGLALIVAGGVVFTLGSILLQKEREMKINGRELTSDEITQEMTQFGRVRSFLEVRSAERAQESRRIGMLLKSHPDGKLLMDTLMDLFYIGDMIGEKPENTYFNLGQRNVVAFLLDLQKEK